MRIRHDLCLSQSPLCTHQFQYRCKLENKSQKEAVIVDISHEIDLFNTLEASYCIEAAYSNFPKGTIHIIGVDSERVGDTQHIAMQWDDHYFICADNGILNTLTQKKIPQKIVAITIHDRLNTDVSDMAVFAAVACHISRGGLLNVIGKEIKSLKEVINIK